MRLIDADKLITALEITITKSDADFESEYLNGIKQGIETALEIVKIAPTVELFCSYLSDREVKQPCVEGPCKDERPTGKYNTHKVACLLAELFDDTCACNYCGIDEWLPQKCDFASKECPDVVGVACWEQFLKHREQEDQK